jgi:hypothetical protein
MIIKIVNFPSQLRNGANCEENPEEEKKGGSAMTFALVKHLQEYNEDLRINIKINFK